MITCQSDFISHTNYTFVEIFNIIFLTSWLYHNKESGFTSETNKPDKEYDHDLTVICTILVQ